MATPTSGTATTIVVGGQAVQVTLGGENGGRITNPLAASDQGLANAEVLYVDPVGPCAQLAAYGTVFALQPGQGWDLIPGQTTVTTVNAVSQGHRFSVVRY